MNKITLMGLIVFSFILVGFGLVLAFVDLESFGVNNNNHGFVSAIFSLSGIILFFTALIYQIKEYSLQVIELKKSVEAQTKSSEALDEQKRLLLEQNSNSLIFGMIESFNAFKERNKTQQVVDELTDFYISIFAQCWQNNSKELRLNKHELNIKFADDIKEIFNDTIKRHELYHDCETLIQFMYNILYIIDINKPNMTRDNFTPFFFNQLNTKEMVLMYLSNLVDFGMPFYGNLSWTQHTTTKIVDMVKTYNQVQIDYKEIDISVLTQRFRELKQSE